MEESTPFRRRSPLPTPVIEQDSFFVSEKDADASYNSSFDDAASTDPFLLSPTRPSKQSRTRPWLVAGGVFTLVALLAVSILNTQHVQSAFHASTVAAKTKMEACGMCASSPATCAKYGIEALQLTRAYQGSGRRLKRVMAKAKRGEQITVGIIGGSVSEGIGVPEGQRWHELVGGWFNSTFDTAAELVIGAVPGRGSEYFMSCHGEHITKNADLIVVELGINDWHSGSPYDIDMETLVRALLNYPNKPAIIFAESFSLTLPKLSSGSDAHLGVANYYDIPVISLRNWLLPELLFDPTAKTSYFFGDRDGTGQHLDWLHIGIDVHRAFGDLINALLDQQLCLSEHGPPPSSPRNIDDPWPNHYNAHHANRIPRLRMSDPWSDETVIPVPNSNCRSLNSPHPESQLTFNEEQTKGWNKWDDDIPWRHVKTYLRGDRVGDRVVFSDVDMVEGTWTLYYLRSNKKRLGNVRCWVDQQEDQALYVEGWWERQMDVGEVLPMHTGLSMGKHDITCEIVDPTNDPEGGHMFLIIAIMWA